MKQSKDPFQAAYEEQEESPPESPIGHEELETQTAAAAASSAQDAGFVAQEDDENFVRGAGLSASNSMYTTPSASIVGNKNKDDDEEEEEDNMEVELSKFSSSSDPVKVVKMQAILKQLTGEQMSRYESFRRSALQKSNMRRLLVSICGTQKISLPMTIVVCGIAKMFVGELVETARMVMTERKDSGPIRPCHIRESYRRLKLEGKIPKRSVPRLFR